MSKAVLISIKPKWCERIANGSKTIEVRKNKPKLDTPFKVYIYCTNNKDMLWILKERESKGKIASIFTAKDVGGATKSNGKVVGEFLCDKVDRIAHCGTRNSDIGLRIVDKNLYCKELDYSYLNECQLSYSDIDKYSNGWDVYGWHISDLVIYDKPRELSEFFKYGFDHPVRLKRPPQSWCYVESEGEGNA